MSGGTPFPDGVSSPFGLYCPGMSSAPTRLSDLPLALRLRLRVSVNDLARLRVGSTLSLDNAVLVSGIGAGHPLAGVRLEMRADGSMIARVQEPSVTTMEALLQTAGDAGRARARVAGPEAVVARSGYSLFRPAPTRSPGAHAGARARLDALVSGVARLIARDPEVFDDPEVQGAGPLRQLGAWADGLHALGRGEAAQIGKARTYRGFDAWLDGFVERWADGALAVCDVLLRRVREGRGLPRDGESAMNLLGLLADTLPAAFEEEGSLLIVCRPLDTAYDPSTMRIVGRQPAGGFEGRVVGQLRVGVLRKGSVVRHADVIVP
jgi:hypothetical protein